MGGIVAVRCGMIAGGTGLGTRRVLRARRGVVRGGTRVVVAPAGRRLDDRNWAYYLHRGCSPAVRYGSR